VSPHSNSLASPKSSSRRVKRRVVGKKCIRHYAADRVLTSFRDASDLLCLRLHQNTVKSGDTKFYRYPREPECKRQWILPGMRHDWAPTEHAKIIFSKNCPHITAVKVVVGVELVQDCSWHRKKAPENLHLTARHKFRSSVNVDQFDSLKGSSNPSNATGTTSSVVMRANPWQNNCSISGYARLEPQSHLIPGSIHRRWHSGSHGYL